MANSSALVCHANTVMTGIRQSWETKIHTDIIIRSDESEVRCHKLVLASASSLLQSLLYQHVEDLSPFESEETVLVLSGVTKIELELLVKFLYTGEIKTEPALQDCLLVLLSRLQISIPKKLSLENDSQADEMTNREKKNANHPEKYPHKVNLVNKTDKFKCDFCEVVLMSKADLEEHVESSHRSLVCDVCTKVVSTYEELIEHKSTHKVTKNYKCSKCGQLFRWRAEYKRHAEAQHGQKITDTTTCTICNKQVVSKRLNEHIKMVHGNEKPFACEQCPKMFAKPSELKNHQRIHTGERPFECEICHASFTYSHILSRHRKYHEGSKKFSCSNCGKSFLQKNDLIKHMRIHSGEKPYKCDMCSKSFARMDYLKKHHMLHLSDTKFCCSECGELCGSVDGLKKHKKHSHQNPKPENPSIELNSFDDLALQLPNLPSIGGDNVLESMSELQAVCLDGGKTIMILNEGEQPVPVYTEVCLEQEGSELVSNAVAVVGDGAGSVVHLQTDQASLEAFTEQAEVLYAVEY